MLLHSPTQLWFSNRLKTENINNIDYKLFDQFSDGSIGIKMYGYAAMAKHSRETAHMKFNPNWIFVYDDPYRKMGDIPKWITEDMKIKVIHIDEFSKQHGYEKNT